MKAYPCLGVQVHIIPSEVSSSPLLPSVETDEIAFAMTLFVAAANGRVQSPDLGRSGFPLRDKHFEFSDDLAESDDDTDETCKTSSEDVPLSRAISVLWHHYNGDERQRAIWSRIVAFHAMTVRSRGLVVERWTKPCAEDESMTFLDPAVVSAVASAPLCEFGQFNDLGFQAVVEGFSSSSTLAASLAPSGLQKMPQFRMVEMLWRPVEDLSGKRGVEALLSRALAASCSEFPWLRAAQLKPNGLIENIGVKEIAIPHPQEAADAELAVIRSLVSLMRTLLGNGVTVRLLENVWPKLASQTGKAAGEPGRWPPVSLEDVVSGRKSADPF